MATVYVRKYDSQKKVSPETEVNFEQAVKMFKRKVENEGILADLRSREYYISPGQKRRMKKKAAERARYIKSLKNQKQY